MKAAIRNGMITMAIALAGLSGINTAHADQWVRNGGYNCHPHKVCWRHCNYRGCWRHCEWRRDRCGYRYY